MRPYLPHRPSDPGPLVGHHAGTLTVQEDNDVFALSDRSDRGYTNGTRLTWAWEERSTPRFALNLADRLVAGENCRRKASISIGHDMFTPENLQKREKIVGRSPALWGLALQRAEPGSQEGEEDRYRLPVPRGRRAQNPTRRKPRVRPSGDRALRARAARVGQSGRGLSRARRILRAPLSSTWSFEITPAGPTWT